MSFERFSESPSPMVPMRSISSPRASEMYFRKMRPRTTCLYSAASMLSRSLSAACQSLASKPSTAPLGPFRPLPAFAFRAIKFPSKVFLGQLQLSLPDHPAAKGVQLGPGQLRRLDLAVLPSVDRGEADAQLPRQVLLAESQLFPNGFHQGSVFSLFPSHRFSSQDRSRDCCICYIT